MWRQVSNLPGECEGAEKDGTGWKPAPTIWDVVAGFQPAGCGEDGERRWDGL